MLRPTLNVSPLQTFLRDGNSLERVKTRYAIKFKRHPVYPNLVLFVYDQIDSPKMSPVVQSARGHILNENDNWNHVCRPFDRFLNEGEGRGQQLEPEFQKSLILKKEDGSLISVWWWDGAWQVSTKGSPDAGGSVGDYQFSFSQLFKRVADQSHLNWDAMDQKNTYVFELCSSYNRVVCNQPVERLVLLAVRNNLTGAELRPTAVAQSLNVQTPQSYDFDSVQNALHSFMSVSALDTEGYVVSEYMDDGRVIRMKVKHPGYLALAHLKEGITQKRLLDLKRMGEEGEFLAVFPEYTDRFNEISNRFEARVLYLEDQWERVKNIFDQKEFALAIKNVPMNGVLFNVRRFGKSIRQELAECNLDILFKSLGFVID
jgi:hypothetical protein